MLERRLGAVLGEAVAVRDLTRLTGGASRETWALEAAGRALVLRRCRPGARSPSLELEARAAGAAAAEGVPTPAVLYVTDDPGDLGGPYLLAERVAGETIARRVFRLLDGEGSVGRHEVARQCGQTLARLHRVGVEALGERAGVGAVEDPVHARYDSVDELGLCSPALELGLRWLDGHRPPPGRRTLVHGDFRVGNLIVGPDGLRAVLDWELAHGGDPLEDLGWFCVRAWRFGADRLVAGGLAPLDVLVGAYEAEAGVTVDRSALAWWTILGTLSWGVICATQADRHLSGAEPSVELAAIGRRVAENEWDVLEALRAAGWAR